MKDLSIEELTSNNPKEILDIEYTPNGKIVTITSIEWRAKTSTYAIMVPDNGYTVNSVVIPDSVTTIGYGAFSCCMMKKVKIPSSVTSIGYCAFCDNLLESVAIPSSVMSIGKDGFHYNNLKNVFIQEGVKEIERGAFYSNQLTSVTIPSSITKIEDYAFSDNKLTNVEIYAPKDKVTLSSKAFEWATDYSDSNIQWKNQN